MSGFAIDWESQRVTCPTVQLSRVWAESKDQAGHARIYVRFAKESCQACPVRAKCTRSAAGPRTLRFKSRAQYEVLNCTKNKGTPRAAIQQGDLGRLLLPHTMGGRHDEARSPVHCARSERPAGVYR